MMAQRGWLVRKNLSDRILTLVIGFGLTLFFFSDKNINLSKLPNNLAVEAEYQSEVTQMLLQPGFKKFAEQPLAHRFIQLRWNQFFEAHNQQAFS
ncbi:hypothetical protein MiSe_14260 [Microseira wollei NIES-4236]|uniref:Uncharacterized protein n=1 Tax=Microseira wollei NIES-4236 TaxID=2530354 RepID=A0AAV3X8I8_9CYAN|nr:hypothetical protein MiSe_14260 [Microseira wollei NIES-4236]